MTVPVHVADQRRPDGTLRRRRMEVAIAPREWVSTVGPAGTVKKEFTAHLHGRQIGQLLLYRDVDGSFDISGSAWRTSTRAPGWPLSCSITRSGSPAPTILRSPPGPLGMARILVDAYGGGRRDGMRVVDRLHRVGPAALALAPDSYTDDLPEQDDIGSFLAPK